MATPEKATKPKEKKRSEGVMSEFGNMFVLRPNYQSASSPELLLLLETGRRFWDVLNNLFLLCLS